MNDNELLETMADIMKSSFIQDLTQNPDAPQLLRTFYEKYQKGETITFKTNAQRREAKETKCDCGARKAKTTHVKWCSYWR